MAKNNGERPNPNLGSVDHEITNADMTDENIDMEISVIDSMLASGKNREGKELLDDDRAFLTQKRDNLKSSQKRASAN